MISGIPLHAHFDDIEPLLKPYGKVEDCAVVSSKDPSTQTVHITFESFEQAQRYFYFVSFVSIIVLKRKNQRVSGNNISILTATTKFFAYPLTNLVSLYSSGPPLA